MYSIGGFFAFWAIFTFIFIAVGIVMYLLSSLGFYQMAINENIENPWLAWIPIANFYIFGKLIRELKIDTFEIPSIELVLPGGFLISLILGRIPFIGWLFTIAFYVLYLFALYKLFKMYKPEQANLWIILSAVIPFTGPIFIFILRNDRPIA